MPLVILLRRNLCLIPHGTPARAAATHARTPLLPPLAPPPLAPPPLAPPPLLAFGHPSATLPSWMTRWASLLSGMMPPLPLPPATFTRVATPPPEALAIFRSLPRAGSGSSAARSPHHGRTIALPLVRPTAALPRTTSCAPIARALLRNAALTALRAPHQGACGRNGCAMSTATTSIIHTSNRAPPGATTPSLLSLAVKMKWCLMRTWHAHAARAHSSGVLPLRSTPPNSATIRPPRRAVATHASKGGHLPLAQRASRLQASNTQSACRPQTSAHRTARTRPRATFAQEAPAHPQRRDRGEHRHP
jgi:hypothetical protein